MSSLAAICVLSGGSHPVFAQQWAITTAPLADWNGVACSADGSNLVAVCFAYIFGLDGIYVSTNRGADWVKTSAPSDRTNLWSAVASSADGVKLAAVSEGGSGAIYTSTNSGLSWEQTSAPNASYSCVACSPDGTKLLAAANYALGTYSSTDSGETWVASRLYEFNNSVAISADGVRMAVASLGGILSYSMNSGATWQQGDAPTNWNWSAVACSTNGTFVVAVGNGRTNFSEPGPIYVSTNSGINWLPTTAPTLNWFCVACSADGSKITAGAPGSGSSVPPGVYSSTNYGATWAPNDTVQSYTNILGVGTIASSADGSKLVAASGFILVNPPPTTTGTRPPNLTIAFVAPESVVVSWSATSSGTLQQNTGLTTTNWIKTSYPITTANGTNHITITPPTGDLFFRLSNP
jgi:hypothetical protein